MTTFSLFYKSKEDDNCIYAVDWSWLSESKWASSEKDGLEWYSKDLNEESYLAILKRFGLKDYTNEFPMGMIINMSPASIIAIRREKEKSLGLETMQVISDAIGNHVLAENCH
ncbi:MAG: hypothetical protein KAI71_04560 [Candidatus Pacebacteria bacterium]|nr:hypothetical protein [Candidatus Paceibacterota bacterium]